MKTPPKSTYAIKAQVFPYPGMAGWFFASLPKKESQEVKSLFGAKSRGWGSLRVEVTIGTTSWKTSIFPDKKSGTYLLPLKAEVRKKEGIKARDTIAITLEVRG